MPSLTLSNPRCNSCRPQPWRSQKVAAEFIRRQPPPKEWICAKCSARSPETARTCIICGTRPPKLQLGYHPIGKAAVTIATQLSKKMAPTMAHQDVQIEVRPSAAAPGPRTLEGAENASARASRQAVAEGLELVLSDESNSDEDEGEDEAEDEDEDEGEDEGEGEDEDEGGEGGEGGEASHDREEGGGSVVDEAAIKAAIEMGTQSKKLPPGWTVRSDFGKVRGYNGPPGSGLKAFSRLEVWTAEYEPARAHSSSPLWWRS